MSYRMLRKNYNKATGISEVISRLRKAEGWNEERCIPFKGCKSSEDDEKMLLEAELETTHNQ